MKKDVSSRMKMCGGEGYQFPGLYLDYNGGDPHLPFGCLYMYTPVF